MSVTADDLDRAVSTVVDTLRGADGDGSTPAGSLEWDCWHTAEHLGDCLMSYACQVVAAPADRYVRFLAAMDTEASFAETLEFVEASGRILVSTVRTAAPTARGWHPSGLADPAGFAGMGCVEVLIHGEDMAQGLGLSLDPPRDICTRVLERMFPELVDSLAGTDAWAALRWCCGRIALPDRDQRDHWRWRGAPLDD